MQAPPVDAASPLAWGGRTPGAGSLTCGHGDTSVPVRYAADVTRAARFWERLGFERFYQLPADGDPGYVGLRRGSAELAVVASDWPRDQFGLSMGDGPRFEMFVYTGDVDRLVAELRAEGVTVLRDPADMPWGERIATGPRPG
jgi:lactoylglutathione lyase